MKRHIATLAFATVGFGLLPSVAYAQNTWVGDFYGQDARLNDDYDWMYGYWKGECGYDTADGENTPILAGVSTNIVQTTFFFDWWTQAILCSSSTISVSKSVNDYVLVIASSDDRKDTSTGDWAPGMYKAECGARDVMVGLAQTTNSGGADLVGTRCMGTLNVSGASDCQSNSNWFQDARESPTFDGDWSYGYYKAQCGEGRYIKGVARYPTQTDELAQEATILCCTPVIN
jgi:hypothetical protein